MALLTSTDLKTMDYAFEAQPFILVPAKNIGLETMDYAFEAQPFVTNLYPQTTQQIPFKIFMIT